MANTKKTSAKRKLLPAVGMLAISATMLATSTYAWFTMNKEVSVQGMQMKARAEEGLLINEVKAYNDAHWDELAFAGDGATFTALRPASTSDLKNWWHANSKKASNEAGASGTTGDTVDSDTVGGAYTDISPANVSKQNFNGSGTGGEKAEKTVYYTNATFGISGTSGNTYDDGEGFYARYTYYLKSSKSDDDLTVSKEHLMATVTATKKNPETSGSGASVELDKALRVGIQVDSDDKNFNIFAPVNGAATTYSVAGSTSGTTYKTDVAAQTAKATINPNSAVDIPKVTEDGIPVYVYVWFEGEDPACKSANLTDVLDTYQIDVVFEDADLV